MSKLKKYLLIIFILTSAATFYSCEKLGIIKKPQQTQIPTTIIQIQQMDGGGQPNALLSFNYEVGFEPLIKFHGAAYPVHILSVASINEFNNGTSRMITESDYMGDKLGDFGAVVLIKNVSDNESSDETISLKLEIEGGRFINKSSININIKKGEQAEVFPRISYDYPALERLTQPANENIYFRLYSGSVQLIEKMEVVRFHSVNEIPYLIIDRNNEEKIIDYTWLFAAYVNEDDPIIDKILQEALKIGTADKIGFGNDFSFSGYQNQESTGLSVDLQALAVWSVFLNKKIKYSNITTTSTFNNNIASQYVRTLGESFGNTQANCVDGTVLFASVLRKIGIDPILILIPGHMFLGYVRDQETWNVLKDFITMTEDENGEPATIKDVMGEEWYTDEELRDFLRYAVGFIETTTLGNTDIERYTKDDSWLGKIKNATGLGKTQSKVTLNSFLTAYSIGDEQFMEGLQYFFDDEYITHQLIDISLSRKSGVKPVVRQ